MLFGETDQPQGGPRMRPEIIAHQLDRRRHGGLTDGHRLDDVGGQRPFDMRYRVSQPQYMGGCLGKPFPLPALKSIFLLLRKLRKLNCSPRVEADEPLRLLWLLRTTASPAVSSRVERFRLGEQLLLRAWPGSTDGETPGPVRQDQRRGGSSLQCAFARRIAV